MSVKYKAKFQDCLLNDDKYNLKQTSIVSATELPAAPKATPCTKRTSIISVTESQLAQEAEMMCSENSRSDQVQTDLNYSLPCLVIV